MSPRHQDTAPLLSVVLVADDEPGLLATVHSLVRQDGPLDDVEVLVVGVSTPDAALLAERGAIVREVQAAPGAAGALAAGLAAMTGAFVTVLRAGDVATPNLVHELRRAADPDRVAAAHSGQPLPARVTVDAAADAVATLAGKVIPAPWCVGVHLPAGLEAGLGAAFLGQVLAPYARRFGTLDTGPSRKGAGVHPGARRRPADTFRDRVEEPLVVVAALCTGRERHPTDRPPLTRALVAEQMAIVAAFRLAHPDEEPRVRRAIQACGVAGIGLAGPGGWPWPGLASVLGGDEPPERHVALVAGSVGPLNSLAREIGLLRRSGAAVDLVYLTGRLDERLKAVPHHRLKVVQERSAVRRGGPATNLTARARRKASRYWEAAVAIGQKAAPRLLPTPWAAARARLHDQLAMDVLASADVVVAMDAEGEAFARAAGGHPEQAVALPALVMAAGPGVPTLGTSDARALAAAAAQLGKRAPGDPGLPPPEVWGMVCWRLYRSSRLEQCLAVADAGARLRPGSATEQGLALFRVLAGITKGKGLGAAGLEVASSVAGAADEAFSSGDHERAAFLLDLVVETLFHGDLQANVAEPPLFTDPARLLEPLTRSAAWRALCASPPAQRPPARPAPETRVLVLPGTYPKFVGQIIDALAGDSVVTVLPLAQLDPRYAVSVSTPTDLHERLQWSSGSTPTLRATVRDAFRDCDVVFADWGDKGAVLASMLAPRECRVVVRFHGVDTLSPWQFLIDWDRVTDVVFVSDHLRRSVERTLGTRIAHARHHVAPNVVDVDRFTEPSRDSAARTLGMVGWGQKVKDPLWTLDLLESLRRHDPAWRLVLVGHDFPARSSRASERACADAFRARAAQSGLVDAIEYVGFTADLPRHLPDIGFAVSSSYRESFHIGAVEMVAAGAVPVFRDWPVYAQVGGVRGLFPEEWVVRSVDEATERILALAEPEAWRAASAAARDEVRTRFSQGATKALYRRIILGEEAD